MFEVAIGPTIALLCKAFFINAYALLLGANVNMASRTSTSSEM